MCLGSVAAWCETTCDDEPQSDIMYCSLADKGSYTDAGTCITHNGGDSSRTPPRDAYSCFEDQCLTSTVFCRRRSVSRGLHGRAMAVVWTRTRGRSTGSDR